MQLSLHIDTFGRIVCEIEDDGERATVTSSDVTAAIGELSGALDATERDGYGECLWTEAGGDYRWMLRRDGNALAVVVLWSHGTLTGWRHLLRAETRFEEFRTRVRESVARLTPQNM